MRLSETTRRRRSAGPLRPTTARGAPDAVSKHRRNAPLLASRSVDDPIERSGASPYLELGIFLPVANRDWIMAYSGRRTPRRSRSTRRDAACGGDGVRLRARPVGVARSRRGHEVLGREHGVHHHRGRARGRHRARRCDRLVQPLLYPPAVAAKMVATIDDVSRGRMGINVVAGAPLQGVRADGPRARRLPGGEVPTTSPSGRRSCSVSGPRTASRTTVGTSTTRTACAARSHCSTRRRPCCARARHRQAWSSPRPRDARVRRRADGREDRRARPRVQGSVPPSWAATSRSTRS